MVLDGATLVGELAAGVVDGVAGVAGRLPLDGALAGGAVLAGEVTVAVLGATVVVAGAEVRAAVEDCFSASFTSAAASTASDSAMTRAAAMIGVRHFAGAARRVRAAAPQRRHQS